MKAKITAKSELKLSNLTRQYTFNIITDTGEEVLTSQVIQARPSEVIAQLQAQVAEYEAVYEEVNDVEVGEEI